MTGENTATTKARLMSIDLGRDIGDIIREMRRSGTSLRRIAEYLTDRTGEPVSYQTVQNWSKNGSGE